MIHLALDHTMAYINSDQFTARGLWNASASYKKAYAMQPFADMVQWPVTVGVPAQPGGTALPKVPGFFVALADSTNQEPTFSGSAYWKLIRLNQ